MPSIQMNAIDTKSDIQSSNPLKSHIPVSLPYDDSDNDSSNNSKKSKRFLFNKLQRSSPKLKCPLDEMTTKEKIALFQSLSQEEKLEFLNQNGNKVIAYINSLPQNQKDQILSKLDSIANELLSGKNLSQGKKKALDNLINKSINGPSGSPDDSDDGITNIMMIIVKAFVENMNTQSLDELEKIFEANLINTYLQNVQNQMQQYIKDQEDTADKMSSKKGFWTPWHIVTIAVAAVTVAVMLVGIFFPPAEIIAGFMEGTWDVGASACDSATSLLNDVGRGGFTFETDGLLDGAEEGETEEVAAAEEAQTEQTASEEAANGGINSSSSSSTSSASDVSNTTTSAGGQTQGTVTKEGNGISNAESGQESPEKIGKEEAKRGKARRRQALKDHYKTNFADKATGFKFIGGKILKAGIYGVGVFGAGMVMASLLDKKNGQQAKQNKINTDQQKVGTATTQSDILNNTEQNVSKRVSDDSEKINQSSGYVQQAINMLGSAMSFKV